jgi:polyisoprenoid-binding protein YceI
VTASTIVHANVGVPPVGSYRIDAPRSTVSFTIRRLFGLATVSGTFRLRDGEIRIGQPVSDSSAHAIIDAASVTTGNAKRDAKVRSGEFLAAGLSPDIAFHSKRLRQTDGTWVLTGALFVRGRRAFIDLTVGPAEIADTWTRFHATGRIDRYQLGITAARGIAGRYLDVSLDIVATRI